MKVLIQRVHQAKVTVNNKISGSINNGLLLLIGISEDDTEKDIDYLACGIPIIGNRRKTTRDLIEEGAGVYYDSLEMEGLDERGLKGLESLQSYRICIHLAWKFLAHHGSSFKHPIVGHIPLVDLAAADYLDYYNKMIQNLDTIALAKYEQQTAEWYNAKKKIVAGGLRVRDVCMKRSNYAPYPYMNLHHLQILEVLV
jgi:hypothetical protein